MMDDTARMLELPDGTILGRSGRYIEVNGTRFYHEIHGKGEPLVLIHGAWATLESFMFQVGEFSRHFRVVLVERRGHGRTPDTPDKFTFRQGAEDMMAVMDSLGIDSAHIVGWSDGAVIGLLMVKGNPGCARKFVSISGTYNIRGYTREFANRSDEAGPESLDDNIVQAYRWTSPDGPDHFGVVFEKIKGMSASHPRFTKRDLEEIGTPTLVMSGDKDIVSLEHTVNLYKGLGNAQLSILPGTSHFLPMERPDQVNSQIIKFLGSDPGETERMSLFRD